MPKSELTFASGTSETTWSPAGGDSGAYIVRHLLADKCCSGYYRSVNGWPKAPAYDDENDEEDEEEDALTVIGGVWEKATGKFVAFWGEDTDDNHIEFYARDDVDGISEALEKITGDLCNKLCPPLRDVFDDGSGTTRDVTLVPAALLDCVEELRDMYEAVDEKQTNKSVGGKRGRSEE